MGPSEIHWRGLISQYFSDDSGTEKLRWYVSFLQIGKGNEELRRENSGATEMEERGINYLRHT